VTTLLTTLCAYDLCSQLLQHAGEKDINEIAIQTRNELSKLNIDNHVVCPPTEGSTLRFKCYLPRVDLNFINSAGSGGGSSSQDED